MAIFRIVGSAIPFIFSTLAFAFVITAFVSRDWARQHYYSPELSPLDWTTPLYTLYRSPYIVCTVNTTNPSANTTQNSVSCLRYTPYGIGKTSCELEHDVGSNGPSVVGDQRLCQQIDFSGNLMLASLVFVSLAFALCLPLTFYAVTSASKTSSMDHAPARNTEEHVEKHHRRKETRAAVVPMYVTAATYVFIIALSVSALATLLSQFYAVLGLIQSSPDNGLFASYKGGSPNLSGDTSRAPWVQGKALSIYASLGWMSNALAAGAAGGFWAVFLRK